MAASSSLAVLFLLLVLVASAVPATAGGGKYSSGARMVIIRGSSGTRVGGTAAGAQSNRWQHYGRRLEDEVAPEELGGLMLGAGEGGIGYGALDKDKPGCQSGNQCAAKGGGSYTRGCTYKEQCEH